MLVHRPDAAIHPRATLVVNVQPPNTSRTMDACIDIHLTRSDTCQVPPFENPAVDHLGNFALNEDNNLKLLSANVNSSHETDRIDIVSQEGQSPTRPSKLDQEPSDIQPRLNSDHGRNCARPQSDSDQVGLLVAPEEVARQVIEMPAPDHPSSAASPLEWAVDPASGPTSPINLNHTQASTMVYCQESSVLRAVRVLQATPPGDEREAEPDNRPLDDGETTGFTCLTGEGKPWEDIDYPYEDALPSLPPSSSPPQLFSSSPLPYTSSQSSIDDVEPSKTVLAAELDICAGSREHIHDDSVVLVAQDDSRLESEDNDNHGIAEVATSPETDKYGSQIGPVLDIEDDPEPSRKRFADYDESNASQPTKRLNLDSPFCLPPAPKRATMASQCHQLKKLAAPFRTPLKPPAATAGPVQTLNGSRVEPTMNALPETSHNKTNRKGSTISLPHKAANTSRSITQFKSPLVNGIISADSRTIRLTPALQTLERKLQLLKRAIKTKENNEEEALTRLAEKWTEAGKEVAYDVWEAVKGTTDFAGKAAFIHRPHGWESTNRVNILWAWDNKPGNPDEESRRLDPSEASCTTGPLTPEEEDDDSRGTLGTMLRQLGIVPEIFGWDDEKEAFCD